MEIEFNIELKRFKNEHRLCIDDIFSALVVIVGIIINFVAFSTTWFWFCFYSSPVPCKSQVDAVNQSGRHPPTPIRGDSYMFSLCVFIQQNVFFSFQNIEPIKCCCFARMKMSLFIDVSFENILLRSRNRMKTWTIQNFPSRNIFIFMMCHLKCACLVLLSHHFGISVALLHFFFFPKVPKHRLTPNTDYCDLFHKCKWRA